VLRIVNSPLYGVSSAINSISHAVILLGFKGIRDLTLGLSGVEMFHESEKSPHLPKERFWEHSLGCAICSRLIADRIGHTLPEESFVGGLLHDIGRMVFSQFLSMSFSATLMEARMTKRPLVQIESEGIGISHSVVGQLLLRKWHFPSTISEAVAAHHSPSVEHGSNLSQLGISVIIMLADSLTRIAGIGFSGETYIHPKDWVMWGKIPFREEDCVSILADLSEQVREIKGYFGMKEKPPLSVQLTLDQENGRPCRLAYFTKNNPRFFSPVRVMLRRFFLVESFPGDGEIQAAIENMKPDLLFVDLSYAETADSETLKLYRNATNSPIVFLLSRKATRETQEKYARIGVFFLSSPFSPQEVADCLSQIDVSRTVESA
jgi:putative nucleotidyltransferase with HDIG domain